MDARPPAALAALTLLLACGAPEPARRAAVVRFVEPPVEELYEPAGLLRETEVAAWDWDQPAEAAQWTPSGAGAAIRREGSVKLFGDAHHRAIRRTVRLDAGRVQAVDVTFGRNLGLGLALQWAAPGEPFSARRSLGVRGREIPPGRFPTVRFPVGDHPEWHGTIGALRLSFAVSEARPVILRRLCALAVAPDPAARAAVIGRPLLVDLGGDARSALLTPPEAPAERPLTVPRGAVLEAVYAVTARGGPPFELRIVFAGDDGGEEVLFADVVSGPQAGAWHPVRVPLDRLAGRSGRLRLASTRTGEPAGANVLGEVALPAWGHPEVLAPAAAPGRGEPAPPNLILISVDTLRADRLGLYGNPRPTTPRIDEWAERRAVVFETAVASAPWTLPAHATMFTGIDAHRHGVNFSSPAPAGLTTVAERLQGAGRRTLAVTGGSFLSPRFGLLQGFDAVHHFTGGHRRDPDELAQGARRAVEMLEKHADRPFFLFFHTYETHTPYRPREPWIRRFHGGTPRMRVDLSRGGLDRPAGFLARSTLRALPLEPGAPVPEATPEELATLALDLYDSAVAYTDLHVGEILAAVRRLGLEERTAVVITSDHGELLGEHGLAGHSYLYDENLLVPLLIAAPDGRGAGRRVARQVRQADVAPTLLELAGLDPASHRTDGRSLVPWLTGAPRADPGAETAISYTPRTGRGAALRVGGRAKYVLHTGIWPPAAGTGLLFDLRRDPSESAPVAAGDGALRRRLIAELERGYAGLYLAVANAGPEPLAVSAEGETISHVGIQSLDLDCECIEKSGPTLIRVEVPPGASFTLRLENPQGRRLRIEAELGGGGEAGRVERRAAADLDLAAIERPAGFTWEAGRWRNEPIPPGAGAAVTGVAVGWAGEAPRPGRTRADERDERLRRQLRALGYVD